MWPMHPSPASWSRHPGGQFCCVGRYRPRNKAGRADFVRDWPPIVLSANTSDQIRNHSLLVLIAAKGAGKVSVDALASCWAGSHPRTPDRREQGPRMSSSWVAVLVVSPPCAGCGGRHAGIPLIDRRNHHVFQPLLYPGRDCGASSPADIALPIRGVLRDQRNVTVRLGEGEFGVDRVAREVLLHAERDCVRLSRSRDRRAAQYFGKDEWATHARG